MVEEVVGVGMQFHSDFSLCRWLCNLGFARLFSNATYFSCQNVIWFVAMNYCMNFYLIVLSPFTDILQIINSFIAFSLQIKAVILLCNCLDILS